MGEKTILVTGGAGYIGSHTCKALAQAGYRPVCYDNLVHGFRELVQWGPLAEGDILDTERLAAVIGIHRPEAVIHFAALIEAGESVTDPAPFYRTNLAGTLSLLEAMRRGKVSDIVFSSTAAVYGEPVRVPMKEDHPVVPINPYGHSKAMAEQAIRDFAAYGISSIILRYFNAAGADPEGQIGRMGDGMTHLIPNLLKVAAGEAPSIGVFGGDYPTPDGTCVRDYIHVTDLANAHVAAVDRFLDCPKAGSGGVFNLGTGKGHSVMQVVRAVEKVTGRRIAVQKAPRRQGDPATVVADAALARRELKWTPRHSDLETMVKTAWGWHLNPASRAPVEASS